MLLHFLIEIEYGKYTSVVRSEIEKTLIKKKEKPEFCKKQICCILVLSARRHIFHAFFFPYPFYIITHKKTGCDIFKFVSIYDTEIS